MKLARHDKILELISREQIETQEELAKRLQAEGFQVTQATVSRDIRQLKLTKTSGPSGRSHYIVQKETQQELGGKYITLGTDSHSVDFVGKGIKEGIEVARKAGFTHYTIYENHKPIQISIE